MGNPTKKLPMIERDGWLLPVEKELTARHESYLRALREIEKSAGSIVDYANGYRYFGWQRDEALEGWWFREWLPGAQDVYLLGDFNGWQRTSLRLDRNPEGVWSIFLPDAMYAERLTHGSLYKIHVHGDNGWHDRIHARAMWRTPPMRPAWYRMRKPRISPPSSGIRSRSTGRATAPLRPAARSYSSTKPT